MPLVDHDHVVEQTRAVRRDLFALDAHVLVRGADIGHALLVAVEDELAGGCIVGECFANRLDDPLSGWMLRPSALFCRARARNARRDDDGVLAQATGEAILGDLELALELSSSAPFAPSAAAGLVRTEAALGFNLDRSDELSADALRAWLLREKVPGRHVQDGEGWDSSLVKVFGVTEIPFNVVVGADGSVIAVNLRGKQLEKTVAGALAAVNVSSTR